MDKGRLAAVAGATGFVGGALLARLAASRRVVGLARVPPRGTPYEWRRCDLFSLLQTEAALEGVEQAFYLVHSMLPSAHLTQGAFQDLDLVCADNFARAAAKAGVRQIVYLGGLIPEADDLSPHLRSRLEVEQALGSRGVPVTTLRAGIVIGPGGSSFRIFRALLERTPLIICPAWAGSLTQPVALDDVLALLCYCAEHPARGNRSFDVGAPDVMSYRDLLRRTAAVIGLKRVFVDVPIQGTGFCRRWLALVSGAPMELVAPLLESIRHSMVCRGRLLQQDAGVPGIPFEVAVKAAVFGERAMTRRGVRLPPLRPRMWESLYRYDVRSVQRMPLPSGKSARWAAQEYARWLPRVFRFLLRAEVDAGRNIRFFAPFFSRPLVEFEFAHDRGDLPDRQVFYITGGWLARPVARSSRRPRLEFREVLGGSALLVAVHDYRPALPWPIYSLTQAFVHLWAMKGFAAHLARLRAAAPLG
ncbi:MAG: hypothetical protein PHF00_02985 [Elusimicrobia bacterium]|nr:hypothetical protein [Elusimicrobiota bacterium]